MRARRPRNRDGAPYGGQLPFRSLMVCRDGRHLLVGFDGRGYVRMNLARARGLARLIEDLTDPRQA